MGHRKNTTREGGKAGKVEKKLHAEPRRQQCRAEKERHERLEVVLGKYGVKSHKQLTDQMLMEISGRLAKQKLFAELGAAGIALMLLQISANITNEIARPKGSMLHLEAGARPSSASHVSVKSSNSTSLVGASPKVAVAAHTADRPAEVPLYTGAGGKANLQSVASGSRRSRRAAMPPSPPKVIAPRNRKLKPKDYHRALMDLRDRACPRYNPDSPWLTEEDRKLERVVIPVFMGPNVVEFSDRLYRDVKEPGESVTVLSAEKLAMVKSVLRKLNDHPELSRSYRFEITDNEKFDRFINPETARRRQVGNEMVNGIVVRARNLESVATSIRPTLSVPYFSLLDLSNVEELTPEYLERTITHELGHLLSLKHPSNYYEEGDHPPYMPDLEDLTQQTVMSYADQVTSKCTRSALLEKYGGEEAVKKALGGGGAIGNEKHDVQRAAMSCIGKHSRRDFSPLDVRAIIAQKEKCAQHGHAANVLSDGTIEAFTAL